MNKKYDIRFYPVKDPKRKWAERQYIEKAPIWCSVDLRDGNQALITPMDLQEKIIFFKELVNIGFKEIEVGFPAASETEYDFVRALIKDDLIPDDVTIQVLTQSREHIIEKTIESIKGAKKAIVHLYNSTSAEQREQVFNKSKEEIIKIATDGIKILKEKIKGIDTKIILEYSPESFSSTEPEFALEICNAVLDEWCPKDGEKVIINLPVTVEVASPHVYADQVEYISENIKYRDDVIISIHPHNDRGCAIADAELALLAGAERVEGTIFGNGERTGNVDIVTLALNMYSQGVDPCLDLSDIPSISQVYEKCTHMQISERQPYAGKLVFAAFSGSHQDAIAKGLKYREKNDLECWTVPYLPIDPKDIGREYQTDVIRINSQSGKGGIGYILENKYGYVLPSKLRDEFRQIVKQISQFDHSELPAEEVLRVFTETYVNINNKIQLIDYHFIRTPDINVTVDLSVDGDNRVIKGRGNGRLDAVANALKNELGIRFSDLTYEEHALSNGSSAQAVTYVSIRTEEGKNVWGVGIHDDIIASSINALFSAINRSMQ